MPDANLRDHKRIIDQGYAVAFGEAMKLERELSGAANRGVQADAVEAARKLVRARGQAQTRGEDRS